MEEKIKEIRTEIESFVAKSAEEVENFRIRYLGSKNVIKDLFKEFKDLDPSLKKEMGAKLNELKNYASSRLEELKSTTSSENSNKSEDSSIDPTLPTPTNLGSRHPISIVRARIIEIFTQLGYELSEGPEIEDDWHNFTALNFPKEHPARDMQDTFFITEDMSLRTHTSSVQVRVMEQSPPPIRTISPGRVFRNEAISARAHCIFHQVECLYIDKDVSFADLKQTLYHFAKTLFGESTQIRFRPSYFPFTEPSAEMDISCNICHGEGCNICKYTGFVEILGCGMVDPAVLENCKIDSEIYSGFAIGMGIERIAMLLHGINDLRLFYENDKQFLEQFRSAY